MRPGEQAIPPLAIDLDGALADTRPIWDDWLRSAESILGIDAAALPADRAAAAEALDREAGNWRTLLERFGEERAPVYLRRDPAVGASLRRLAGAGRDLGVFTDAPAVLAQVALTHLGADRRIGAIEAGADALPRLLARLGADAVVVRTPEDLLRVAQEPARGVRSSMFRSRAEHGRPDP